MFDQIVGWCRTIVSQGLRHIRPSAVVIVLGAAADLVRGKQELVVGNAFLRQQLVVLIP